MIIASNLCVEFSGAPLFENVSFTVNPRDRIGLVGKNGAGKSTLLKVMMGVQSLTRGEISTKGDQTVGYLPQEIKTNSNKTVKEETLSAFEDVLQLEKDLDLVNHQLTEHSDPSDPEFEFLLHEQDRLLQKINMSDKNKVEGSVEKILKGLGFKETDFTRKMSEFSGGWQMRVELAKLLLLEHDLLLLDEPTNHLDIDSILWLEQWLIQYPGAIMMVSHDRMFLDNITNRTIEIVFGGIYDYKAHYSKFVVLRQERYEQQIAAQKNTQKYIEQQQDFIDRFRSKNTKAKQVQSRIKALEKIENVHLDILDERQIRFKFPPAPHSGKVVLKGEKLSKSYDGKVIFSGLDMEIVKGDRVSFVGKNGTGKSTLVKMITEKLQFDGKLELGHQVSVGYYAQVQENTLNPKKNVFDTIGDVATGDWTKETNIRKLLGAFLFTKDDVTKPVSVLSGGEKSRLALARLLLNPVNLLILDEPTNHLDMSSKDVLKDALLNFDGTLILVSHDREFLSGLTTKTFEFVDHKVKTHIGPIEDFLANHAIEDFRAYESQGKGDKNKKEEKIETASSDNKVNYQGRKEAQKEIRKAKNDLQRSEEDVAKLEKDIAKLEEAMLAPDFFKDGNKMRETNQKHAELSKNLDKAMKTWEKAIQSMEEVETRLSQFL